MSTSKQFVLVPNGNGFDVVHKPTNNVFRAFNMTQRQRERRGEHAPRMLLEDAQASVDLCNEAIGANP